MGWVVWILGVKLIFVSLFPLRFAGVESGRRRRRRRALTAFGTTSGWPLIGFGPPGLATLSTGCPASGLPLETCWQTNSLRHRTTKRNSRPTTFLHYLIIPFASLFLCLFPSFFLHLSSFTVLLTRALPPPHPHNPNEER